MSDLLKSKLIYKNIWQIEGPANDLIYLVLGDQKAMLVDTGMGIGQLPAEIKKITSLPVTVINTHGHPDHAGGNSNFQQVWFPFKDLELMKVMCTTEFRRSDLLNFPQEDPARASELLAAFVNYREVRLLPYAEGSTFDLGGCELSAIEIPGHTPGSMGVYDSEKKILFAGDSLVCGQVWMYLEVSLPLQTYYNALVHLREKTPGLKLILTGHLPTLAEPDLLDDLILCAQEIMQKPGIGEPTTTFAGHGLLWNHGKGHIIYDPQRILNTTLI
jgi:hydroxyacylglutathione hydrolase